MDWLEPRLSLTGAAPRSARRDARVISYSESVEALLQTQGRAGRARPLQGKNPRCNTGTWVTRGETQKCPPPFIRQRMLGHLKVAATQTLVTSH